MRERFNQDKRCKMFLAYSIVSDVQNFVFFFLQVPLSWLVFASPPTQNFAMWPQPIAEVGHAPPASTH